MSPADAAYALKEDVCAALSPVEIASGVRRRLREAAKSVDGRSDAARDDEPTLLTWSHALSGETFVIFFSGCITAATAERFREALADAPSISRAFRATLIRVNLSGVETMSSIGLKIIVDFHRELGPQADLVLAAPTAAVREILAISRVDQLVTVE